MFKTAFSYAYHFVFLQETVGVFNFEKKSVTLEQLVLWEGAHKGSSAALSVEGGKSLLNSLAFRSQYNFAYNK